jgi:hypothetical protein
MYHYYEAFIHLKEDIMTRYKLGCILEKTGIVMMVFFGAMFLLSIM